MDLCDILIRFLQYTTEVSVQCWDEKKESLKEFERRHCFLPQVQSMLTAPSLELVMTHLSELCLYELKDLLGMRLLIFRFEKKVLLMGPYVTEEWKDEQAETLFAGLSLPASYLLPYQLYYCSYRLLDEQTARRIVSGAITALHPDYPPYLHQSLVGLKGESESSLLCREPLDFDLVVRQYEQENKFLQLIENGEPQAALEAYYQLGKMNTNQLFLADNIRAGTANATIVRTQVRKAAERGGVHPAVVDAVSQSYAQRMYAASTVEEVNALLPKMILEFGETVRTARRERYSPPIRKVVGYIMLHLSQEITLTKLAQTAGVTPNHLSRQFKLETGYTVSRYIAQKRCEKAAALLRGTSLEIQEISAHVGYLDNNYFVKVFKNIYDMTPTAYRADFGFVS